MATPRNNQEADLTDERVAFVGRLGGVNKREAQQLVRQHGGTPVDKPADQATLIVIGADELPLVNQEELLDEATRKAAATGHVAIISETQLWERLGLVETEQNVRRLYTPAMLADLLGVSVATIRSWRRRGLIVPAREVRRLPYFDFQEVATARRLAELLAAGASPTAIEKKLAELSRYVPEVERPLAQLSVIVEGRQILLRQGEGLIEPGGQLRFDFEALEAASAALDDEEPATVSIEARVDDADAPATPEAILALAGDLEDDGRLQEATDMYRAAMAAGGPKPEISFQLAELLYRQGDLSAARERYYVAVELDEDFVEARANLGCVLAEMGQRDLAVSAFQGALKFHRDYPDVHYHLARTLDELTRHEEAVEHWHEFLRLAPDSPWADEAMSRLAELGHDLNEAVAEEAQDA